MRVEEFYSGVFAARLIGITEAGFYRDMRAYPLPADAVVNGRGVWRRESLLRWYEQVVPLPGGHAKPSRGGG